MLRHLSTASGSTTAAMTFFQDAAASLYLSIAIYLVARSSLSLKSAPFPSFGSSISSKPSQSTETKKAPPVPAEAPPGRPRRIGAPRSPSRAASTSCSASRRHRTPQMPEVLRAQHGRRGPGEAKAAKLFSNMTRRKQVLALRPHRASRKEGGPWQARGCSSQTISWIRRLSWRSLDGAHYGSGCGGSSFPRLHLAANGRNLPPTQGEDGRSCVGPGSDTEAERRDTLRRAGSKSGRCTR